MILSIETREMLGLLAPLLCCIGDARYIWSIFRGRTRPHLFSWIVWTLVSGIVFIGQMIAGGGAGTWLTGYNTAVCATFAILAVRRGEKTITRGDWTALALSLAGIPAWLLTRDPLWSIAVETAICLGIFYPTVRKSYLDPFSEAAGTYALSAIGFALNLIAMDNPSLTTLLYPVTITATNSAFAAMLIWRRHMLEIE